MSLNIWKVSTVLSGYETLDFVHKFFVDILIHVEYFCGLFVNPVYRAFVILC